MSIRREHHQSDKSNDSGEAFISLLNDLRVEAIDRRTFLTHIATLLAATTLPLTVRADIKNITKATESTQHIEEPWRTLAAVQDHLFPTTDDAPGASEIHATAYLKAVLAEPDMDPDDREFIKSGVTWLNDIAGQRQHAEFVDLDEDQREAVLRQIEKTRAGRRWLSLLLLYTFEALLSDPVYGGNPGGIGWQWLEHQAGFPRPTVHQRYQELKKL